MPKRTSTRKNADANQLAKSILDQVTGDEPERPMTEAEQRSLAARLLGSLGGKKGGKARAKALSPAKRKAIAQKAAAARWKKPTD
ncbi:MAG: hypothetical protein IT464_11340 [Planctomycetes bacterium]|nr:hypothetical protein [Planctomycetota bacterium]